MSAKYSISPKVGVARLGNSPSDFYLAPETIGGKPINCDAFGNEKCGHEKYVENYKDSVGRIKRQAAKFKILKHCNGETHEVMLSDGDIDKIVWTVHIANKKPIWYTFSELQGNLEFGENNSYQEQHIPRNNPDITDSDSRKKLMIDPGPRSIDTPNKIIDFSRYNIPSDYVFGSFPPVSAGGLQIDTLGELRMDKNGFLIALGGFGKVTGSADITSFRGAGGYWDDISDGYVIATIHFKDGTTIDADPSWLLVGSPKYAPELVNITTLYDTMYNVAIRNFKLDECIYTATGKFSPTPESFPEDYPLLDGYNPDYEVSYPTQIKPIIERMQSYRWVADIPYLTDFANPNFDFTDNSDSNKENRMQYFNYFRTPVSAELYYEWIGKVKNGPNQLFSSDGIPLMPLNSGDNSVTNSGPIYKFETLSVTQYFFLYQWARGKFNLEKKDAKNNKLDEVSVGNCVGAPFSPGIETTWITRNASIYSAPFQLKVAHYDGNKNIETYYSENGLSITADEAEGLGCEPGDLTKRMAIPWQADFQECTVQTPNISDISINQFADGTGIEVPPAYYVYWWPPQSPMHVVTGSLNPGDQVLDAIVSEIDGQPIIPAGQRVPYQRGINNVQDMINSWSRLGFIVNQGSDNYPYFVEHERDNGAFGQLAALQTATKISATKPK